MPEPKFDEGAGSNIYQAVRVFGEIDVHTSTDKATSSAAINKSASKHIEDIQKDGYTIFPGAMTREQVDEYLACVKKHVEREKGQDSHMPGPYLVNGTKADVVLNAQMKDYTFLKALFCSQDLNDTLLHFLNDKWYKKIPQDEPNYILNSFIARSPNDRQPLHLDAYMPYLGNYVTNMQSLYVLEDMNEDNGCTILVPGSHNSGQYCSQEAVEEAIPIVAKAGDIVLWDGRIWHGTESNKTTGTRWTLVAHFVRWWIKQIFNVKCIPQETIDKLTNSQKAVLGLCSLPFNNEFEGVDIRGGYERLES